MVLLTREQTPVSFRKACTGHAHYVSNRARARQRRPGAGRPLLIVQSQIDYDQDRLDFTASRFDIARIDSKTNRSIQLCLIIAFECADP